MNQPIAKILTEFNQTELWNINFSKLIEIITRSLNARAYAVFTKNKNRYNLLLNQGFNKSVTIKEIAKRTSWSLKFRMEDRDLRLFIVPGEKISFKKYDLALLQNTIGLISKTLSMRQISKNRILETQIINELNLNVITTLNEKKIIHTLEKAARKMIRNEKIWLFCLINDSLIGSHAQVKIKNIPGTIYFKLFRGRQIFTTSSRINIFKQLSDNSDRQSIMIFIPL